MKLKVRRCGAQGWPWMVVCPSCPKGPHHEDTAPGQRGINTPIGWKTQLGAMQVADRHVRWHQSGRGA